MTRSALTPARRFAFLLASGLSAAWLIAASAQADPRVLATVDGQPITDQDVADALADIGPGLPQKLEGPARQKYLLDYLIDLKLAAGKAKADKLDQGADFARRLDYYHDKLAMESLLSQVGKSAATDEAEHKAYDEAAKANPPVEEVHARHILLPTEDEAKAALARVKGGEDFAKVATELSKDPAGDGGDLGWFTKDRMVPEFADAAFKLQPGQISDPVKSQFGWHIIKLEDRRMRTFPPFAELKDQAARFVEQKAQSDLITSLHATAKIERADDSGNLVPEPAPTPSAAPTSDDAAKPKTP
jgi:peptidyl-prolyl cis-trans isomerase C